MKIYTWIILILLSLNLAAQDQRTVETRVADLLALFPSKDAGYTEKLMSDMLSLSDAGLKMICNQVIPAGSGDDTRPRFAVESFSRYLSGKGSATDRDRWEKICLGYIADRQDYTVKDFFMKQLQQAGGEASVIAMKEYLADPNLCSPAVAVIGAIGGKKAEDILSESLRDKSLACAASVMNTLAEMGSDVAVNEFISWYGSPENNLKRASLNAMARSGSPAAFPVLSKAARGVSYRWETTGATGSFLNFARAAAEKGDRNSMMKVCRTLIKNCNDRDNIQYKTGALGTLVYNLGAESMPYIYQAMGSNDKSYRNAALTFINNVSDSRVTDDLMAFYPKAKPEARPEIIRALGNRKDVKAAGLVESALSDIDSNVRVEAAAALVKLVMEPDYAVRPLIDYLVKWQNIMDQAAAGSALRSVLSGKNTAMLIPALESSGNPGKRTIIELLAWKSDPAYFSNVYNYVNSPDEQLKSTSIKALVNLSSENDQQKLIGLLEQILNPSHTGDLQTALGNAANREKDPEKRASVILRALKASANKEKLIPVLAMTGGREALSAVLKEFEEGSPEIRSICFKTLTSWKDYTASSALYEICASGNKTWEAPAFEGYVKQVRSAPVTDDQRLLLYRKIMPYARDAARKIQVINELGKIKTYTSLFFTSVWLDDPETRAAAARAVMYIALPSADGRPGMYGINVREILTKAVPALSGPESEYDRELVSKYIQSMPPDDGFVSMFNGRDLSGWQGLVSNPVARAKMKPEELRKRQSEADTKMSGNWNVRDGCIYFSGKGDNLCSVKEYTDFEMLVDWKITKGGDSGIYLRGTPQVQIWDTSRTEVGAQVGSGGLYNNQKNPSKPIRVADNLVGEWNTFRIIMLGDKVSVWLNGILVTDNVVMENYWDRSSPIFPTGPIELQAHGNELAFRDIYVKEINEKVYNLTPEEKKDGFEALFNGRNLDNWVGNKESYVAEDGNIVIKPDKGSGGNLFTEKEYSDFIFRFEFQLTPAANNGLGIRAPLKGDAAYLGMELQILDDTAPVYSKLQPYQYHGSVYGVIPARKGFLKPVGEWNYQEVIARGTQIKVTLNGTIIVDGDIAEARDKGTMDKREHPGLKNSTGHIGFLGHGSEVKFRNIRIKELK